MTSDRKRKCSGSDDDASVGCRRRRSGGGGCRSIHADVFDVCASSAVIRQTTHDEQQHVPDGPPPRRREHSHDDDDNDRLPCVPLSVVNVWNNNWGRFGAPCLLVEPTLCRESVAPVLLLNGCCQLTN